jgi:hypothetical protein
LLSALAVAVLAATWRVAHAEPEEITPDEAQTQPSAVTPLSSDPAPLALTPPVPPRVSVRRSPAAVKEFGWNAGLGVGALLGGPQLILLSAYPFRVAADFFGRSGGESVNVGGVFAGIFVGAAAVVTVGLGVIESAVGGIYHRSNARLQPDGSDAELQRAWSAGLMKGVGSVLIIHGTLNLVTCGAVLGVSLNRDLGTMTRSLRDISIVGVAVGGLDMIIGGTLVLVSSQRTLNSRRVALLPTALPGGAGVVLGGAF